MSQLIAMFCDIDDFCKRFESIYTQRLLHSGQRQRRRQNQLSLSEMMTIIVQFHASHYRDFKHYSTKYVEGYRRPYFPDLVSYSRFVDLMPRALVPLNVVCWRTSYDLTPPVNSHAIILGHHPYGDNHHPAATRIGWAHGTAWTLSAASAFTRGGVLVHHHHFTANPPHHQGISHRGADKSLYRLVRHSVAQH